LRTLHDENKISELIEALNDFRSNQKTSKPIIFKISPNIGTSEVEKLAEIFLNKKIDGLILTNTSIEGKEHLRGKDREEAGGLSGSPIYTLSNKIISSFYKLLKGKVPIIGVGGVSDGETAYEKIKAGANLVQLYTSLVFKGPYVASNINEDITEFLKRDGFKNISEAVGVNANQ
jgi:dihydroorotate dehydrogenase